MHIYTYSVSAPAPAELCRRTLPLEFRRIFRPRPPRPFPRTELFVPLCRNLTSRSVPRSFSRAPGRR